MAIPLNPYVAGNPVGDSPAFVGRTDVLREVLRILRRPQDNAVVLYGQRRIGKTSILQNLAVWLSRLGPYRPIYLDLQDKAAWPMSRFLRELARTIAHVLGQPDPGSSTEPSSRDQAEGFVQVPGHDYETVFREEWLPAMLDTLPDGSSLVLLFDEFDVLADPQSEQAAAAFFPYLRGLLASDPRRLQFVFVIGRNVDDLANIALFLFKSTPAKRVSLLSREDTADLVRLSEANDTLLWPIDGVERVWQLTSGHPFLTQQLCSHIWERLYDEEPDEPPAVSPQDVDVVVPDVLDASRNMLEWLWDGLPPAERVVASALAEAGAGPIAQEALERLLHESGVHVVIRELQNAPQLLQDWDLVEPADGGYRFRVELLRRWIAERKPLKRVQEELDRIEPVADSLYEASLGLYRGGQLIQAIAPLRQAVNLNPNHVGANQLLADILLARGEIGEARQLLERLFEYQPAAARPRLVQALLVDARTAEGDDDQLALYDRVLDLDSTHPEAIAGRRRIWQRRGEVASEAGDLQAALVAYREAGAAERVALVEVLLRRQMLAALAAEAQAHERAGEWAEAVAAYQQLLAQALDDESRTAWQIALERCWQERELACLFDKGVAALKQGNRQVAQRAFAKVVYHRSDYQRAGERAAWLLTQAISREPIAVSWQQHRRRLRWAVVLSMIAACLTLLGGGWAAETYYFQPREVARQAQATAYVGSLVTVVQQTAAARDATSAVIAQATVTALANRDATATARDIALASAATADAAALVGTSAAQVETLRCRDIGRHSLAVVPDPTLYPPAGTVHVVGEPLRTVRATWVVTNTGECPWGRVTFHPLAGGEAVEPTLRWGGEPVARVEPGDPVEMTLVFSVWEARGVDMEWVMVVNDLPLFDQPHLRLVVGRWVVVVTPTPTPSDLPTIAGTPGPTPPATPLSTLPAPTATPEPSPPVATLEPSPATGTPESLTASLSLSSCPIISVEGPACPILSSTVTPYP